jgi:membrane fusion protein (multidrug efflux system)
MPKARHRKQSSPQPKLRAHRRLRGRAGRTRRPDVKKKKRSLGAADPRTGALGRRRWYGYELVDDRPVHGFHRRRLYRRRYRHDLAEGDRLRRQGERAVANQQVKAGDVLATLDDGDYKLALEQAQASLDTEKLSLQRIDAQIAGGEASLDQAKAQKVALEATVRGAQITQTRASDLQAKSVGTTASLDSANISLDQARANLVGGDAASRRPKPTSRCCTPSAAKPKARSASSGLPATRPRAIFPSPC